MFDEESGNLRALDALNFCNAGIQTGLGPFIAIDYTAAKTLESRDKSVFFWRANRWRE